MNKNKPKPVSPAIAALHELRPKGRGQWGAFLIGMAVACYIALVILSKLFLMLPLRGGWPVYLLFPVLAPAIYWLMCFALRRFPETKSGKKKKKAETTIKKTRRLKDLYPTVYAARQRLSPAVFAWAFLAVFGVTMTGLLAFYPGLSMLSDIRVQWEQVRTGTFDAWHPPIHTMLIWLVTRIHYSYGAFIAAQVLFFSFLCGYMAATMRAWGFHAAWTASFVIAAVCAHKAMLYAYKDALFACFVIWAAVCLINIVLSGGVWLGKWGNRIAFAVALAFASMLRNNGIAFTIPVIILLCVFYAKKQTLACIFTSCLTLLMVVGVRGPLYKAVGVTQAAAKQNYLAAICPSLTVLGSIYQVAPDALDEEGIRFMYYLVGPGIKGQEIVFGDGRGFMSFFPIYFENYEEEFRERTDEFVSLYPPEKLLAMVLRAVKNEPNLALKALATANRVVWDPAAVLYAYQRDEELIRDFIVQNQGNAAALSTITPICIHPEFVAETIAASKNGFLRAFQAPYRVIDILLRCFPPGYLLQCTGVAMLALPLCTWISLRRRRNWAVLLLTLPSLAYNLGTMLLIGGPDYRYFILNAIITIPLILACLAKAKEAGPDCG